MKELILTTGFFSETPRTYGGEPVMSVLETTEDEGTAKYLLENGMRIMEIGPDMYRTEWNAEEFWGRVDEVETDDAGAQVATTRLGFVILRVDREKGFRLYKTERKPK